MSESLNTQSKTNRCLGLILFAALNFCLMPGLRAGPLDEWAAMKSRQPKDYVCFRAIGPMQISVIKT